MQAASSTSISAHLWRRAVSVYELQLIFRGVIWYLCSNSREGLAGSSKHRNYLRNLWSDPADWRFAMCPKCSRSPVCKSQHHFALSIMPLPFLRSEPCHFESYGRRFQQPIFKHAIIFTVWEAYLPQLVKEDKILTGLFSKSRVLSAQSRAWMFTTASCRLFVSTGLLKWTRRGVLSLIWIASRSFFPWTYWRKHWDEPTPVEQDNSSRVAAINIP